MPIGKLDFVCNSIIITPDNEYKLTACMTNGLDAKHKLDRLNKIRVSKSQAVQF